MSSGHRVPAGTDTGGQFAANPHTAPGVTLAGPADEHAHREDVAGNDTAGNDSAEFDELVRDNEQRQAIDDRVQRRAAKLLAALVARHVPTAAHVDLRVSDQGDSMELFQIIDAQGARVGQDA